MREIRNEGSKLLVEDPRVTYGQAKQAQVDWNDRNERSCDQRE